MTISLFYKNKMLLLLNYGEDNIIMMNWISDLSYGSGRSARKNFEQVTIQRVSKKDQIFFWCMYGSFAVLVGVFIFLAFIGLPYAIVSFTVATIGMRLIIERKNLKDYFNSSTKRKEYFLRPIYMGLGYDITLPYHLWNENDPTNEFETWLKDNNISYVTFYRISVFVLRKNDAMTIKMRWG